MQDILNGKLYNLSHHHKNLQNIRRFLNLNLNSNCIHCIHSSICKFCINDGRLCKLRNDYPKNIHYCISKFRYLAKNYLYMKCNRILSKFYIQVGIVCKFLRLNQGMCYLGMYKYLILKMY